MKIKYWTYKLLALGCRRTSNYRSLPISSLESTSRAPRSSTHVSSRKQTPASVETDRTSDYTSALSSGPTPVSVPNQANELDLLGIPEEILLLIFKKTLVLLLEDKTIEDDKKGYALYINPFFRIVFQEER